MVPWWLALHGPAWTAAQRELATHLALSFTPHVCEEGRDVLLLETAASLKLFGGPQQLRQRWLALWQAHGLAAPPMASATTALAAAWRVRAGPADGGPRDGPYEGPGRSRARGGHEGLSTTAESLQRFLSPLPLRVLADVLPQWSEAQAMGLHTLGDVWRMPRDGLSRRFGPALVLALDRACGRAPDVRTWIAPAPVFDEVVELPWRAHTQAQLMPAAQALLQRLMVWATARRERVLRWSVVLEHERHAGRTPERSEACSTTVAVALAQPSADGLHCAQLLRERLAQTSWPEAVLQVRLRCEETVPVPAPNAELFPTRASAQEGMTQLLERLQARLGAPRVHRLRALQDHRPERATAWCAWSPGAAGAGSVSRRARADHLPHLTRPAWLLPTPEPLPERAARPCLDGHPLKLLAGPERIESGWWDGQPALRDYFVAQCRDGALVWVFRTRLSAEPEAGWFLHGRFG